MDFKGYFSTGDGTRCDPFTITDAHSRYLIRCQTVSRMDLSQVVAVCEAAMHEYGMPSGIRTDNGRPFAGNGLLGLSKLSLSWTKMGIVHERIQPGRPQQNGRHERMHRTLKEDTTKLPAQTLRLPQKKLDRFKRAGDGLQVTAQKMQVDRRVGELRMAERKRFLELMEAKHQTYL